MTNATDLPKSIRNIFPIFEDKDSFGEPHLYFIAPIRLFISTRPLYFVTNKQKFIIEDKNRNWQLNLCTERKCGTLVSIHNSYPESFYFDMYDLNIDVISTDDYQSMRRNWTIRNIIND